MQQDARRVEFLGGAAQVYVQTPNQLGIDRQPMVDAGAVLQLTIRVIEPFEQMVLAIHSVYPSYSDMDISAQLAELPLNEWQVLEFLLAKFDQDERIDFSNVNSPMLLYSETAGTIDLGCVKYHIAHNL